MFACQPCLRYGKSVDLVDLHKQSEFTPPASRR
jgi:hypothetical protein